ncbi:hypothetical protein CRE_24699 [Caenorhabditis remanei]|uniref:Uncharacterized protein n=1 Tax=Caenorhabditis remanei TaxID=31234 RepID=E3N3W0_CAERE|nr:hypothetical protein CRE_24699 [Caenorhabditis remanei]
MDLLSKVSNENVGTLEQWDLFGIYFLLHNKRNEIRPLRLWCLFRFYEHQIINFDTSKCRKHIKNKKKKNKKEKKNKKNK